MWVQGASQSGAVPAGGLCVDVSDSLSDTFEYMAFEVANGRSFVLRSRENRNLAVPINGIRSLHGVVRQRPSIATRLVDVLGKNAEHFEVLYACGTTRRTSKSEKDGFPGWITLWRGWMTLQTMVDGHRLDRTRQNKCCRT